MKKKSFDNHISAKKKRNDVELVFYTISTTLQLASVCCTISVMVLVFPTVVVLQYSIGDL